MKRNKRNLFAGIKQSLSDKETRDTKMLNAMPWVAMALVALLYLGEYVHRSMQDGLPLQMSVNLELKK